MKKRKCLQYGKPFSFLPFRPQKSIGIKYDILVVDGIKKHLIPKISEFISNIDLPNKKIYINYIKGLDLED